MRINRSIPKTEKILKKNGLSIDKNDAVVYLHGFEYDEKVAGETITYRETVSVIRYNDTFDSIKFVYSSTKHYSFPDCRILEHLKMTHEQWFDYFEKVIITLAVELGMSGITVDSGRKDAKFLSEKGYVKRKGREYIFDKKISQEEIIELEGL